MGQNLPKILRSTEKTYEIIRSLGEGGTSVVYLAKDGDREVALKILGEQIDQKFFDRYVESLKNEFNILSKLRHPNLAEVYDFGYSEELGKYFFTSEFVQGAELYDVSENMDYESCEELLVQLLLSLDYLHRNGIIHCDIKCANILVTEVNGTKIIKLVDFGFSTRHLSHQKEVIGTVRYLAPELMMQMKEVDDRVDLYSAGIVLYRMLHRSFPFTHTQFQDVLDWHRKGEESYIDELLPTYTKELIRRMIATYPSDRFSSCLSVLEFINLHTEGHYKKTLAKMTRLQPSEGPLIGRDSELEVLDAMIGDLKKQKPPSNPLIVVTGPQGMGKSRLFKETKYRAQLNDVTVKEVVCVKDRDITDTFMRLFDHLNDQKISRVDPSSGESNQNKKFIYADWCNRLIDFYKDRSLIIMIDELHFSSQQFMEFLHVLNERLFVRKNEGEQISILTILSAHPEVDLSEVVLNWLQSVDYMEMPLCPLTFDNIKCYVHALGLTRIDSKASKQILKFSGGVPQLVEAYCQHVMSSDGLSKPPNTLAESYILRAKSLDDKMRQCLNLLALSKRPLTSFDISEIIGAKSESPIPNFQTLVDEGFAKTTYPSKEMEIFNVAMADAIQENMKESERKNLGHSLGLWLERKNPDHYPELTTYFEFSGDREKVRDYSIKAAEEYNANYNGADSLLYYSIAKKYTTNQEELYKIERTIAKIHIFMGQYEETINILKNLIQKKKATVEDYRFLGLSYTKKREFKEAAKWYQEGLNRITDQSDIKEIVIFKNSLGNVHFYMGNLSEAEICFKEATAGATADLLLNNNLGLILSARGKYDEAIEFYENRKSYLESTKDQRALALCHAQIGYIQQTHHHFPEAIKSFEASYSISDEIGDRQNILVVLGNLVRIYRQVAQYTKALEYSEKSLEIEGKIGSLEEIAQNHLTIGSLYETLGVNDLAESNLEKSTEYFSTHDKTMYLWSLLSLSYVYRDKEDFQKSNDGLDDVISLAKKEGLDEMRDWGILSKADLWCEYEKYKETEVLVKTLTKDWSEEFAIRRCLLECKIGVYFHDDSAGQTKLLEHLVEECQDKEFLELIWEVREVLGVAYEKNKHHQEAFYQFSQASELIESITKNLNESYQESYKRQRLRWSILTRLNPALEKKNALKSSKSSSQIDSQAGLTNKTDVFGSDDVTGVFGAEDETGVYEVEGNGSSDDKASPLKNRH